MTMYFLMYLLTIVEKITAVAEIVVYGSIICLVVSLIFIAGCTYDGDEVMAATFSKIRKFSTVVFGVSCFLYVFIPSQKGLAFVFIAPSIIENGHIKETVKNIPELTRLGTEYLKEILQEKVEEKNK